MKSITVDISLSGELPFSQEKQNGIPFACMGNTMFCPKCKYEYVEGITECPDCKEPLNHELTAESVPLGKDLVVFRVYYTRHEAEFGKSVLDANGIEAMIASDDAGGYGPGLTFARGVALLVKQVDMERAEAIFEGSNELPENTIQEEE